MILSVPWYMFNGLEHTAILSHILTFITGSSSRKKIIGSYIRVNIKKKNIGLCPKLGNTYYHVIITELVHPIWIFLKDDFC
jgi:hypothetical protein